MLHGPRTFFNFNGQLDVFTLKCRNEYYENGWRIGSDLTGISYRVTLGGTPISTRVGDLFSHKNRRTYYDHGWCEMVFHIT